MIELQSVSKYYGEKEAVNDLSFHIREGEIFGLIGTSGCGKTTTLKMINQLVKPSSGRILIDGQESNTKQPEELRREIGYVIQNVGLFPHYTVQQNIATVPKLLDWQGQHIQSRVEELLQLVGLNREGFESRVPDELSGGEQQRVGLARALAADPPIILMDEPFGALDPITKRQVRCEVKQLFSQIEKTIVLVTHDIVEAFDMCNRLCLLDYGKVQQIGTPKELLFQPQNDFVDSFFEANRLQLEMMSITMGDILEALDSDSAQVKNLSSEGKEFGDGQIEGDDGTIISKHSFFSIFKDSDSKETYMVRDQESQSMASVTLDELLKGFHKVRRKLKGKQDD